MAHYRGVHVVFDVALPKEGSCPSNLGLSESVAGDLVSIIEGISDSLGFTVVVGAEHIVPDIEPDILNQILGLQSAIVNNTVLKHKNYIGTLGLEGVVGVQPPFHGIVERLGLSTQIGKNANRDRGSASEFGFDDLIIGERPGEPTLLPEIIGFGDLVMASTERFRGLVFGLGFEMEVGVSNLGNLTPFLPPGLTYRFYAVLTGGGGEDYEISNLKTVQLKLRGVDASHVTLSADYSAELEAQISLRSGGALVVYMASRYQGTELLREPLISVDFVDVRYDMGGLNRSATIHGAAVLTFPVDVAYLVDLISTRTTQGDKSTYRFSNPDFYIRPGFVGAYGQERFVVDEVSYYMSSKEYYMDVSFDPQTLTGHEDQHLPLYFVEGHRPQEFRAVLTGAQNGKDDLEFSGLISMDCRLTPGAPSYLSVQVVYESGLKQQIEERFNGRVSLFLKEGEGSEQEYMWVNFNRVSFDIRSKIPTATLVGYRMIRFAKGAVHSLDGVVYKQIQSGGGVRFRTFPADLNILPMSIVIYGGVEYIVGEVTIQNTAQTSSSSLKVYSNVIADGPAVAGLGLLGQITSNTFYPVGVASNVGLGGVVRASLNKVETAGLDSAIGFYDYIVAELI